jgi:dTDP-4-dehydrorhamnose 3,5-epimerase-like enzyme
MISGTIMFNILGDDRGSLISLEANQNIPFDIKRVYYIYATKENVKRGLHAHINLKQVAICVNGSCKILLDNGENKQVVNMDKPSKGVILQEMIWREMYDFSEDCVLMVLASELYDENDYIRDYSDYLLLKKGQLK